MIRKYYDGQATRGGGDPKPKEIKLDLIYWGNLSEDAVVCKIMEALSDGYANILIAPSQKEAKGEALLSGNLDIKS